MNLQELALRLFSKQLWLPFHHVSVGENIKRDKIEATLAGLEPADTDYYSVALPFCYVVAFSIRAEKFKKYWSGQSDLNRLLTVLQTAAFVRLAMPARENGKWIIDSG